MIQSETVPLLATATNKFILDAHTIDVQLTLAAEVLLVQLIPSGEVITRFPVPVLDTAANNPKDGDQLIPVKVLLLGVV